jgi:SWI/SNF-related matrix-associated actin-dependent regulator 1 of chromatin subfamily A
MVICPSSVKGVWADEAIKWETGLSVRIHQGRKEVRLPTPGELLVINPEVLPDSWPAVPPGLQLIVDECHAFKNPKAKRSKSLKLLVKGIRDAGGSTLGATGTPILTSPADLAGLLINFDMLKDTYKTMNQFHYMFRAYQGFWGLEYPPDPPKTALDPVRPFILRRVKSEVLTDLPGKIHDTYKVQIKKRTDDPSLTEEQVDSKHLAKNPHIATWRKEVALAKAKEAVDYIRELSESEPVIVFSAHRDAIDFIQDALDCLKITGGTHSTEKTEIVKRFQSGENKVIAGTIGAMGVGLTLTKSARVIFLDRDWTPALNMQAEDRACRLGQTKGVIITDVVSDNPVDQIVTKVLVKKTKLLQNTTDTL